MGLDELQRNCHKTATKLQQACSTKLEQLQSNLSYHTSPMLDMVSTLLYLAQMVYSRVFYAPASRDSDHMHYIYNSRSCIRHSPQITW
jgi:hypothetical protein